MKNIFSGPLPELVVFLARNGAVEVTLETIGTFNLTDRCTATPAPWDHSLLHLGASIREESELIHIGYARLPKPVA